MCFKGCPLSTQLPPAALPMLLGHWGCTRCERLSLCLGTRRGGQLSFAIRPRFNRQFKACCEYQNHTQTSLSPGRRQALLLGTLLISSFRDSAGAAQTPNTFVDPKKRYQLQPPPGWSQVSKAGAEALFEDPQQKGTNLGVTVLPVRINSLDQFGSIDTVGSKLINTERAKESTLSAAMLQQIRRQGPDGKTLYDFDYVIDSTRGAKRVLSTVTVSGQRLFIINGNVKCKSPACDSDAVSATVATLQQAMQSFVNS